MEGRQISSFQPTDKGLYPASSRDALFYPRTGKIHPTAIIDPAARIADDVTIGPFVCIEGPVVIGPGCVIETRAILTGTVRMGRNNFVGHGSIIGAVPQDHSFNPKIHSEVIIGDNNRFYEYCTIHRGAMQDSVTRVGSHNCFMAGIHLAHNTSVGSHVTMANNVLLAGHVEVQDHAYIGGGAVFHQHVRIGQFVLARGKSRITKDIPPFTIAALNSIVGVNFPALRRAGFTPGERAELKAAFKLLYRSGLNTSQALERARRMKWNSKGRVFFDFVKAAKKRGICDLRISRSVREELFLDSLIKA